RVRRHASRTFWNGLAVPALTALVSSPNRVPFDPRATGTALVSWRNRIEFDPRATETNAGGGVWRSGRPIPERETSPSIRPSWNRRPVLLRVRMAILRGWG